MKRPVKEIDTLSFMVKHTTGRRRGNSTRQVDYAIQKLFEGYEVIVYDHHESGDNGNVNRELKRRIIKRLEAEHKLLTPRQVQNLKKGGGLYPYKNVICEDNSRNSLWLSENP